MSGNPLLLNAGRRFLTGSHDPHVFAYPFHWCALGGLPVNTFHEINPLIFSWQDQPIGAAVFYPLGYRQVVRRKNAFLRTLEPVGQTEFDYHDPIAYGLNGRSLPHFWESFALEVNERWRGAFDRVVLNGLRVRPARDGTEVSDRAPYIPIGRFSSADDFLGSLGKSLRGDIRRQLPPVGGVGPVSFRVLRPDETDTALTWLPEILAQHTEKMAQQLQAPRLSCRSGTRGPAGRPIARFRINGW